KVLSRHSVLLPLLQVISHDHTVSRLPPVHRSRSDIGHSILRKYARGPESRSVDRYYIDWREMPQWTEHRQPRRLSTSGCLWTIYIDGRGTPLQRGYRSTCSRGVEYRGSGYSLH